MYKGFLFFCFLSYLLNTVFFVRMLAFVYADYNAKPYVE